MKQTASDYLHWVLQDNVKRILESQESCEVGGATEEWVGLQRSGWGYRGVGGATEEWVELQRSGWGYRGVGGATEELFSCADYCYLTAILLH